MLGHPHVACGGGDRTGVANAFEQLGFAGANTSARLENDTDSPVSCLTVPRAAAIFEARGAMPAGIFLCLVQLIVIQRNFRHPV